MVQIYCQKVQLSEYGSSTSQTTDGWLMSYITPKQVTAALTKI